MARKMVTQRTKRKAFPAKNTYFLAIGESCVLQTHLFQEKNLRFTIDKCSPNEIRRASLSP